MHSGDEDLRLAAYCAAGKARNGVMLPVAIIDLFYLRPIPVRHSFPYAYRHDIILWYVVNTWAHVSIEDFLFSALCIFLPPQML
jgi:hypothetical protein